MTGTKVINEQETGVMVNKSAFLDMNSCWKDDSYVDANVDARLINSALNAGQVLNTYDLVWFL